MSSNDPRGYALEFRESFLEASAKVLPNVVWRDLSICEMEYPTQSPVLGPLTVIFEADQITLYCGRRHHLHFTFFEGDIREEAPRIAAQALTFIRELTSDDIVVRWAPYGSWTASARQPGRLERLWRLVTPWVREALWSGGRAA